MDLRILVAGVLLGVVLAALAVGSYLLGKSAGGGEKELVAVVASPEAPTSSVTVTATPMALPTAVATATALPRVLVDAPPQQQSDVNRGLISQWNACQNSWQTGQAIEFTISLSAGNEYSRQQYQDLKTYLEANCIGIGTRVGSIPAIGQSRSGAGGTVCFDMLTAGSITADTISLMRGSDPVYFLTFAKQEIDNLLAAARCR